MTPHVVLVHGSRLSHAQWAAVVARLGSRVTSAALDLPGHGRLSAEPFTLPRGVAVVDDVVRAAPAGAPVVLVGHSLGGYVAMAYAAQHGDWLAGLVLAGASAIPAGPGAAVYRAVARLTDALGPARMGRVYDAVLTRRYDPQLVAAVQAGGYSFGDTRAMWGAVMEACHPAMLRRFTGPVLLLNGQWDQFRLGERAFLRHLPNASLQVIPGATHFSCLDRPAAFADAVARFAAALDVH